MFVFVFLLCEVKSVLIAAVITLVLLRIQHVGPGGLSRRIPGDVS